MHPENMRPAKLSAGEVERLLAEEFPQAFYDDSGLAIEATWAGGCRVRQAYRERLLRPGGTISGPAMMSLADFAFYVALLACIGPQPLAVTTNLNINFLRKPERQDLIAEVGILKLGKRLAVMECRIFSDGEPEVVAHVTSTYSIPTAQR
jgi:uncharacterized protein (TIGR00369 family)